MQFLADENVAPRVVAALRHAGHDIFDVKEVGWFGRADRSLAAYAQKTGRIILTHDKDFLQQTSVAVLLLRFRNQNPEHVTNRLLAFLKTSYVRRLRGKTRAVLNEFTIEFYH